MKSLRPCLLLPEVGWSRYLHGVPVAAGRRFAPVVVATWEQLPVAARRGLQAHWGAAVPGRPWSFTVA